MKETQQQDNLKLKETGDHQCNGVGENTPAEYFRNQ